ncbi:winged helix-turn-helix transcriptional regulator [Paraburkholderia strydomiana]
MNCSIAKAPDQVGKWWSLLIVRECTQGVRRFDEFQARLGIARNILTTRLERLTGLGVLERFPLEGRARVDGYRLTPKGEDLYPVLVALMQRGDRWLLKDEQPPTVLLEDATGEQSIFLRFTANQAEDCPFATCVSPRVPEQRTRHEL